MSPATERLGHVGVAAAPVDRTGVVTVGFTTTVAMWAIGYFGRLPAVTLPSPAMLVLMLLCLVGSGAIHARRDGIRPLEGALAGGVCGLLNLLILGSFLSDPEAVAIVPSALWWVPGSILVSALLVGVGARLAARDAARGGDAVGWSSRFAWVAVAATMLLLGVGGLVTSAQAGMAVHDWPTSFGYNMFLYPFSRMTGGIFYEHAHRLLGFLVGVTTLVLAVLLQRVDRRAAVRRAGWLAVILVAVQGVLGGLRVTGNDLALAMTHGVLAQLFFSTLVVLATVTTPTWIGGREPSVRASVRSDRRLGGLLLGLLLVQLVLGASQRHFNQLVLVHMTVGIALVTPAAIALGVRAWGLNPQQRIVQRFGQFLIGAICLQVVLGLVAWIVTGAADAGALSRGFDLVLATAHQWFGAVVLATAVSLVCWHFRLVRAAPAGEDPTAR